jgi:hypothetical protein
MLEEGVSDFGSKTTCRDWRMPARTMMWPVPPQAHWFSRKRAAAWRITFRWTGFSAIRLTRLLLRRARLLLPRLRPRALLLLASGSAPKR